MTLQTVWDLHFVDEGIVEISTYHGVSGIRHHIFASQEAAFAFACRTPFRQHMIQCRKWHADFLDSPFVTDHRESRA
jgi:hypothetical protein